MAEEGLAPLVVLAASLCPVGGLIAFDDDFNDSSIDAWLSVTPFFDRKDMSLFSYWFYCWALLDSILSIYLNNNNLNFQI